MYKKKIWTNPWIIFVKKKKKKKWIQSRSLKSELRNRKLLLYVWTKPIHKCLNAFQCKIFFYAVAIIEVTSLVSLNLVQKQYHHVQLELLHHHIKFHLDQLKSVQENDAYRLCFVLILRHPSQGQGQWKWYTMAEVTGAYSTAATKTFRRKVYV